MTKELDDLLEQASREAEEYDRTADPDAPLPPHVKITRGHGRSRVLQVRLSEDEMTLVEKLAAEQHLPPSTFVRSILLKALAPTASSNAS